MSKLIDLTGKRFMHLTVIRLHHRNNGAWWLCRCDCGNRSIVTGTNLRANHAKTCGYNCELTVNSGRFKMKHGFSKTKLYHAWMQMIHRCHNPENKSYKHYGARGITVYEKRIHPRKYPLD